LHLLRLERQSLAGEEIKAYLPILRSFLSFRDSAAELRTVVETRGQRADGEAFLAHVWLSTFVRDSGLCLAALIWDSSENLRDHEGTGPDSMMATSRVLIGAISHEIRNLAAAASVAYRDLARGPAHARHDQFHALGAVMDALENISTSGLKLAAHSSAAVADLGMVLDEARVLTEASFRDEVSVDLVRIRFLDSGPGVSNPDTLFKPFQPEARVVASKCSSERPKMAVPPQHRSVVAIKVERASQLLPVAVAFRPPRPQSSPSTRSPVTRPRDYRASLAPSIKCWVNNCGHPASKARRAVGKHQAPRVGEAWNAYIARHRAHEGAPPGPPLRASRTVLLCDKHWPIAMVGPVVPQFWDSGALVDGQAVSVVRYNAQSAHTAAVAPAANNVDSTYGARASAGLDVAKGRAVAPP
jgi:hypothetical protein